MNNRKISRLAALAASTALLSLGHTAYAQDNTETSAPDSDTAAATIIVWSTAVTSNDPTLGEQDIAIRQADHLSDLLRSVPGVDVGGTHSVNTRINFRGMDDRVLNVYIDGALQTNFLYHHMGNLLVNPDILKSADIQLGANSVTYGGLGGAIRFETKDASDLVLPGRTLGGRLSGSWNSNASKAGSATVYGATEHVDLLGYYSQVDRDNFTDGSGRDTIGSDGTTRNALIKAKFKIDDKQFVRVSIDRLWDEGDYTQRPDMGALTNAAITGDILLPTEYSRLTLNATYGLDLGDALDMEFTLYANDMELYRIETDPGIPRGIGTDRQVNADNWGANLVAQSDLGDDGMRHVLTYGAEYFDQKLDYLINLPGATPEIQRADSLGIYLEDRIELADDRFAIRPGIRYNTYSIANEVAGSSADFDKITWGIAGEAEPVDGLRFSASYTTLFRGPELAEPFGGPAGNKVANPALLPETGSNMEFGGRYTADLGDGSISFGGRYFITDITDYIAEVATADERGAPVQDANIGDAKIDGFEISANAGFGNFNILANYASANLDTSGLIGAATTESLREVGDSMGGEISWSSPVDNLVVSLNGRHVFDKLSVAGNTKEGYSVVNFSAMWDGVFGIAPLSVLFAVDNLLGETYTSHASREGVTNHPVFGTLILNDVEPGRNVKITAAVRF